MSGHRRSDLSAVTSVSPCTIAVAAMKRFGGVVMPESDAAAAERDVERHRDCLHGPDAQGGANPAPGVGMEQDALLFGEHECFPNADGGQRQRVGRIGQPFARATRKAIRLKQAPEPDVGVEEEVHVPSMAFGWTVFRAQGVPVGWVGCRRDDVPEDFT